ncbi:uncharacterized protein LOC128736108 [Sabethes cyaneus]|uniref:uncharacterized protein LOC128736108 n=1 Tax=Sabethes cyaneus TaxID=53552 RepID=UPI00237D5467|nr:uncharacterized protein LOC128736108 [Sabethes cyaneus]
MANGSLEKQTEKRVIKSKKELLTTILTDDGESFNQKLIKKLGIQGVQHALDRKKHFLERILWLLLIALAMYGALFIGLHQMERFRANPTVIQLDKNYRDWVGTMPAATICFQKRFDYSRALSYIERNNLTNRKDSAQLQHMVDFIQTIVNLTGTNFNTLALLPTSMTNERLANVDIPSLLSEVHPNHDVVIYGFNQVQDKLLIKKVMTERGICYMLNSAFTEIQINAIKRFVPLYII